MEGIFHLILLLTLMIRRFSLIDTCTFVAATATTATATAAAAAAAAAITIYSSDHPLSISLRTFFVIGAVSSLSVSLIDSGSVFVV